MKTLGPHVRATGAAKLKSRLPAAADDAKVFEPVDEGAGKTWRISTR
jgi:hypothetical protein